MTQPRYPRKFVPKPGIVATIYYYSQSAPDSKPIPHFANGTTGVSAHSVDEILALGYVEVFDHLPAEAAECTPELPQPCVPAEQIRYGAREPDGTRTVIVEDAGQDTRTVAELRAEVNYWKNIKLEGAWWLTEKTAEAENIRLRIAIASLGDDKTTHVSALEVLEAVCVAASGELEGLRAEVERLKDHDKYNVPHDVQERIKDLRTELAERKTTARRAAQMLIEEVGAPGPESVDETAVRAVNKIKAMRERADELTARAEAAEAERDAIRVQWQSLSDEREEERAALRRRGVRFVKVGGILEAIIPIDEPKAYTPTKPGELDRLLHEAHAESLTPATVNDAAKIEAFTHTEWKRGTKDGCGGELRPHLIELVRKSDYDALQGRCEALTKECDEWKAEAERCGQFELRQVEEREAIKRAVGFEENGPSLPEWCAKIARNLASEEAACSQLIDERDGAQDAADHLASNILGEPIDWSFHAEKWNEAREAALALRTQLAEANKRCDELTEHERQTHERLGAILGSDDSLEECAKRLKAEVERLKESFDAVWSVCVECGMKEEKMSAEDAAESGCDEGDVYACQYGFIRNLHRRAEAAEAELNRLRNQLRIEYSRNDALARIRDAVGRIAQVFGDGIYVMPIDSELGSVQMALNRYKELETRVAKCEACSAALADAKEAT